MSSQRTTLTFVLHTAQAYPDVSAQASDYRVFVAGNATLVSGTSAAAPAFAGAVALLNSARLDAGLPPLGFLNPLIYAHPGLFNDVAAGDNPGCGTRGFSARAGWDPVTGVGTPNFAKLRDAISQAAGAA